MSTTYYEFLPIYERNIFYTDDLHSLQKEMYKYFKKDDIDLQDTVIGAADNCLGFSLGVCKSSDPLRIVAFVMYVGKGQNIGVVAHEATHIANKIFAYIGQDADEINDEVQAYLIGHLVSTFMKEVRGVNERDRRLIKGEYQKNIK